MEGTFAKNNKAIFNNEHGDSNNKNIFKIAIVAYASPLFLYTILKEGRTCCTLLTQHVIFIFGFGAEF